MSLCRGKEFSLGAGASPVVQSGIDMKTAPLWLCAILLLAGCTSAQRTHIAWLDTNYEPNHKEHGPIQAFESQRLLAQPLKGNVEVYHQGHLPDRPYHEIAFFSVDGNGNEEADAIQGFVDLARHAGADAVIIDLPVNSRDEKNGEPAPTLLANQRYIFHGTAIVWKTNEPAEAPATNAK